MLMRNLFLHQSITRAIKTKIKTKIKIVQLYLKVNSKPKKGIAFKWYYFFRIRNFSKLIRRKKKKKVTEV